MVMTMSDQRPAQTDQRPKSEYDRLEYERCEVCGAPITRGTMPKGPYENPVFIQCHNKQNGERCGHRNRFPRH